MGPFKVLRRQADPQDLRSVELFQDLDGSDLERLADWFVELSVPGQRLILQEGKTSEAFFVIAEGAVAVFRDAIGSPVHLLTRLSKGDFFGELGLFVEGRHAASVRASEPCRLLKITKKDLLRFLDDHPAVLHRLQMSAARRHSANLASTLDMGRRREVRIRCSHEIALTLDDGSTFRVFLENLSLGGVCIRQAPKTWAVGDDVAFYLGIRENEVRLSGRVAWRQGDSLGLAFINKSKNHDMIIQMATRLLLELGS